MRILPMNLAHVFYALCGVRIACIGFVVLYLTLVVLDSSCAGFKRLTLFDMSIVMLTPSMNAILN